MFQQHNPAQLNGTEPIMRISKIKKVPIEQHILAIKQEQQEFEEEKKLEE